jgi:predicted metal-dependent peptidase
VLAQFVTSCYGGSRRWLPPNRRHISRGLYLQSSRKEHLQAAVAIDTSGSTTADLPQFFSELTSLLNTFGDYELTVIQCDSKIQHVEKFDVYNQFHSPDWKTFGHGGTDFRPPFVYVAKHPEIEPSCLIYITDGYGPAPDNPPPYPVLWILTDDGEKPSPWGRELRLQSS